MVHPDAVVGHGQEIVNPVEVGAGLGGVGVVGVLEQLAQRGGQAGDLLAADEINGSGPGSEAGHYAADQPFAILTVLEGPAASHDPVLDAAPVHIRSPPVDIGDIEIASILLHRDPTRIDPPIEAQISNLVIGSEVEVDAIRPQSLADGL